MPAESTFVVSFQQLSGENLSGEMSINIWVKQNVDSIAFQLSFDFHNMNVYSFHNCHYRTFIYSHKQYIQISNFIQNINFTFSFLWFVCQGLLLVIKCKTYFISKYLKYKRNMFVHTYKEGNSNTQRFGRNIKNNC